MAKMLTGEFTRFDVFSGPINDNNGKEIVPAGAKLEQVDLDQFPGENCRVQVLHEVVGRRHHRRTAPEP